MRSLKIRRKPGKPILPGELLEAARRAYAQVDGRDATDLTEQDVARRDLFAQAFVGHLPADVIERLANPEMPTWEERVTTALRGVFTSVVDLAWLDRGDRKAFRILVWKIKDVATRDGMEPIDVLRKVPSRSLEHLSINENPAATLTNLISLITEPVSASSR
jgi:hypothetical protein